MANDTTYRPSGLTQSVAYSGTAASVTVPSACTKIRLWTSTNAFVVISRAAVATVATTTYGMPVTSSVYEYLSVVPGDVVSFIQSAISGIGYITPMSA